ncbi:hypothetical protein IGI95_002678 [Enterococcus sp. DIV0784]|uniref:hypothetical protein n=1 Tax=unclassified Enterococcus TaxID=2608891 RepID=UPI003F260916
MVANKKCLILVTGMIISLVGFNNSQESFASENSKANTDISIRLERKVDSSVLPGNNSGDSSTTNSEQVDPSGTANSQNQTSQKNPSSAGTSANSSKVDNKQKGTLLKAGSITNQWGIIGVILIGLAGVIKYFDRRFKRMN